MDGKREEAIRAKTVAEKKMEKKDFSSALGLAMKAQQLDPDLQDISHIILVCDVLCSANIKVNGNENDWYAILKVEATADEATIRKQYRKFALNLHPDKNKITGASEAFNLIFQAQNVLLDRNKRIVYDMKLQTARSKVKRGNYQLYTQPDVKRQPPYQNCCINKFASKNNNPQQQVKSESANGSTFWTMCPHCLSRFMYYKNILGVKLACQQCRMIFTTLEDKSFTSQTISSRPNSMQREETGTDRPKQASERVPEKCYSKIELKKNVSDNKTSESQNGFVTVAVETSKSKREHSNGRSLLNRPLDIGKLGSKIPDKRKLSEPNSRIDKKRKVERSDSGSEEKQIPGNGDYEGGLCMNTGGNQIRVTVRERSLSKEVSQHGKKDAEKEFHRYPDSEFRSFDDLRDKAIFKKGQIWAVYDSLDAMPRFYAIITKVCYPDFKVELTWLEPDPDHEEEIKWIKEGLPVSCGKFRCGNSDIIKDIEMFSHLVYWEKSMGKGTYEVHPRRGEIWALFKDWDINWYARSETKKKYAYEFVEVLSDYSSAEGVYVSFLTKLGGFSCTYSREKRGSNSVLIPAKEKFRFSHEVPSFKVTEKDSNKLVTESFELDPASLPTPEDGTVFSDGSILVDKEMHPSSIYSESSVDLEVNRKDNPEGFTVKKDTESIRKLDIPAAGFDKVEGKQKFCSPLKDVVVLHAVSTENKNLASNLQSDMEATPISSSAHKMQLATKPACNATSTQDSTRSASKFYNFDQDKSSDKLGTGQIWAIYHDEATAPKYYGKIKKIDPFPEFKIYVAWLQTFSPPEGNISLVSKGSSIGCGKFKVKPGRPTQYTNTDLFSHQVKVEPSDKKQIIYSIFPKKGEIWAMYRDCKNGLNDYRCEIVEVMEENDISLTVSILEPVEGFKCVFKPQVKGMPNGAVQINRTELFRFSHQIPAYQLTEEKGGRLHGLWELNTAALQNYLLNP